MSRYPEIEVRIEPGRGIGEADHPYWADFFSGQVFGELHRADKDDRSEFIANAMKMDPETLIGYAAEWVTVIDEKGFVIKEPQR